MIKSTLLLNFNYTKAMRLLRLNVYYIGGDTKIL